jgi:hypothetical protein
MSEYQSNWNEKKNYIFESQNKNKKIISIVRKM